ncbi:putative mitochondrial glycoprotein [Botrytis fragariae]|uniref:Putative mitochondrial glycoprotein n=1 Tax=Botrytis fragariae TaxID=1964551 RepID=A0A8H6AZM6_9HELO|nr:putative mitochondrial glycoprotein [Botrytis fragariae]KAF5876713.1 putative mitochondrial glycoprotein [Botrytis fragariae]
MLSLRTLTRSAPRVARGLTSTAIKTATRPSLLQAAFPASRLQCASAFSTSSIRAKSAAPESDAELVEKLASEIQMEEEMKEHEELPTSVKDYMENGPFEILDTPGQEEVVLTRSFGDEKIRVSFSIADLNAYDPDSDEFQDRAMSDEDPNIDPADPSELDPENPSDAEGESHGFPARVNIIVEKKGKGALAIETVAEDGMIVIDNVYYYADAAHAYAKTTEAVHQRQDMYVGPPYGNLDEDLQVLMERYLDERGINQALAIFVPDYIDMKEQKEYLRWLKNVKGFVEA